MTVLTRRVEHRSPRHPASTVAALLAAAGLTLTLAACGGSDGAGTKEEALAAAIEDAVGTGSDDIDAAFEELAAEAMAGPPPRPDEPLGVGDCSDGMWYQAPAAEIPSVDCDDEHSEEVYLAVPLDSLGAAFPGRWAGHDYAKQACEDGFESYVGISHELSRYQVGILEPTEESWADGDRTALCFAQSRRIETWTGTLEGSAA